MSGLEADAQYDKLRWQLISAMAALGLTEQQGDLFAATGRPDDAVSS
jgi:hypothetical protein